jgi:hypothetical protein
MVCCISAVLFSRIFGELPRAGLPQSFHRRCRHDGETLPPETEWTTEEKLYAAALLLALGAWTSHMLAQI